MVLKVNFYPNESRGPAGPQRLVTALNQTLLTPSHWTKHKKTVTSNEKIIACFFLIFRMYPFLICFICRAMKPVQIVLSSSHDILENLAYEEYLVAHGKKDVLLFYINRPAVVMGKHQNPWNEVNLAAAKEQGFTMARRLSGGGTVYHDMGNINFSFIRNKDEDFVNFREHIEPIAQALESLGVSNHITPRNDLFIGEHKISGNAEHVNNRSKRIIHHGTLLYDSDIVSLGLSIQPKDYRIETHAVQSVRSPVTNIRKVCDLGTTTDFLELLIKRLTTLLSVEEVKTVDLAADDWIKEKVRTKYATWEWTFGHTPQFTLYLNNRVFKIRKGNVIESEDPLLLGKRCDELLKL